MRNRSGDQSNHGPEQSAANSTHSQGRIATAPRPTRRIGMMSYYFIEDQATGPVFAIITSEVVIHGILARGCASRITMGF